MYCDCNVYLKRYRISVRHYLGQRDTPRSSRPNKEANI